MIEAIHFVPANPMWFCADALCRAIRKQMDQGLTVRLCFDARRTLVIPAEYRLEQVKRRKVWLRAPDGALVTYNVR